MQIVNFVRRKRATLDASMMHRLDYVVTKLTEQHPEEVVRASYLAPNVSIRILNVVYYRVITFTLTSA